MQVVPEKGDRRIDRQMDGQTDKTDGQTDNGQSDPYVVFASPAQGFSRLFLGLNFGPIPNGKSAYIFPKRR